MLMAGPGLRGADGLASSFYRPYSHHSRSSLSSHRCLATMLFILLPQHLAQVLACRMLYKGLLMSGALVE